MTDLPALEPGIARVEITALDEETARRAGAALDCAVWETSGPTDPYRVPGEDGVRVRLYARVTATEKP